MKKSLIWKVLVVVSLTIFCFGCSDWDNSKALNKMTADLASKETKLTEATTKLAAKEKEVTTVTTELANVKAKLEVKEKELTEANAKLTACLDAKKKAPIKKKVSSSIKAKPATKPAAQASTPVPVATPAAQAAKVEPCSQGSCGKNVWDPKDHPRQPLPGQVSKRTY